MEYVDQDTTIRCRGPANGLTCRRQKAPNGDSLEKLGHGETGTSWLGTIRPFGDDRIHSKRAENWLLSESDTFPVPRKNHSEAIALRQRSMRIG